MSGTLWQDLRYGLRMLVTYPGFTAMAVIALALGIGANTTIFSVVNAVLLKPLPYREPERLVKVLQSPLNPEKGLMPSFWSYPRFEVLRDQSQSFASVAAYPQGPFNFTGTDAPERLQVELVSASYFSLLGVEPLVGRALLPEEDETSGAQTVALISYGLWQRRYGGHSEVAGKTIELDKHAFTIIGVLPAGFRGQQGTCDVWIPITTVTILRYPRILTNAMTYWFEVVGRLNPGVTHSQAQQEMLAITGAIEQAYPTPSKRGPHGEGKPVVTLASWRDANVDPAIRRSFLILLAAVGFVLLIACANVANLLLARAVAREKEFAVRLALGASRLRIVRQLLTESVLLSLTGGLIGVFVALWGIDLLINFKPSDEAGFWTVYARTFDFFKIRLDGRVLAFNFAVTVMTAILFGLIPALQSSRPNLNEALKEGTGSSAAGFRPLRRISSRSLLVIAQVTLSFVVLVGAGLMIKSLLRLQSVNLGFEARGVTTMSASSRDAKLEFYQQLLARLKSIPGVESASLGTSAPLLGYSSKTVLEINGRPKDETPIVGVHSVSPDYFKSLGIKVIRGRGFMERDRIGAPRVAVINKTFAERIFADEDPIGKRIKPFISPQYTNAVEFVEVVGIVDDVKYEKIENIVEPDVYLSYLQPIEPTSTLIVRSSLDTSALTSAVRREVMALDKDVPLTRIQTMTERSAELTSRTRFIATLLGLFAGLALLLSALGIYGVIAYSVSARTREIGIRMALGARAADVFKLVMLEGFTVIIVGLIVGLGTAFAVTRVLTSQLYSVSATDPLTFASIAFLLVGVALLACYIPARRATRVDPIVALRYE